MGEVEVFIKMCMLVLVSLAVDERRGDVHVTAIATAMAMAMTKIT